MAMRVTQGMLYSNSVNGMNSTLNALVDSNIQSASQKKINKPSDDPVGAGRMISYNASIDQLSWYKDNIDQATGWLSTIDSIISGSGSVMTVLTSIKELAEQGATGTYTSENREQIAYSLRQYQQQLMNLANTTYTGKSVFAGQKVDSNAYEAALAINIKDSGTGLDNTKITVEGSASYTIVVQPVGGPSGTGTEAAQDASYRYSMDGGNSWIDIPASDVTIDGNGNLRILAGTATIVMDDPTAQVNVVDTKNDLSTDNGTWMYIYPTAQYGGDDNDNQVVIPYGSTVTGTANGTFSRDVSIRIDDTSAYPDVTYSYSIDDGSTWTQATTTTSGLPVKLAVSGGYLELSGVPSDGEQYIIHPHRADINLAISQTDSITVNLVGKDVFGGIYQNPATGEYETVDNGGNMFEVVGKLIAAAETNDQDGMGAALDELDDVMQVILTAAADVGGRENRLEVTAYAIQTNTYAQTDRLSSIADVDVAELTTRLAMQQLAYTSVLQSSSTIMQLSLLNYL